MKTDNMNTVKQKRERKENQVKENKEKKAVS
jgi:hypothetical protein